MIGIGLLIRTQEAGYLWRVLDQMVCLVGHFHLDQHIAREKSPLALDLAAAADFDHLFGRHQHLLEKFAKTLLHRLLLDRFGHLFSKFE